MPKKRPASASDGAQLDLDLTVAPPAARAPAAPQRPSMQEPPEADQPKILSVSDLTRNIQLLLEDNFPDVWVEGEVSNLRRQPSGICYFTLKDARAQLRCILYIHGPAGGQSALLADGVLLEVQGALTVYHRQGHYQLRVHALRPKGAGVLAAKLEALKSKLKDEGLFDDARKRPLPRFPSRVGVITSVTGAAIRDFLKILHRRNPGIAVLIYPTRVQGAGAAAEIVEAIRNMGRLPEFGIAPVDVIVITRGGGSLEDLWEFNEESVVRAVAASPIPVVSAIGHEIDFTLCDFAADVRAATPSAAAEILAADAAELAARLHRDVARLQAAGRAAARLAATRLRGSLSSALFREPSRRTLEARQTLDRLEARLVQGASRWAERRRTRLDHLASRFDTRRPLLLLQASHSHLQNIWSSLNQSLQKKQEALARCLERTESKLQALSPFATLARGYTLTLDASGRLLRSAAAARTASILRTRFADGEVLSQPQPEP